MKLIIFLLSVIIYTVFVYSQISTAAKASASGKSGARGIAKIFAEMVRQCKAQENVTEDELKALGNKELPTTTAGKCFIACMMEKCRLMKNGTYDKERAMRLAEKSFKNKKTLSAAKALIEKCSQQSVSEDRCEAAFEFATCVRDNMPPELKMPHAAAA
uniref:Odorant binding protein 9 n=1 Tax=Subpsaltria yangi TaxID=1195109 RepID=A0A385IUP5_9HEMI|nr:odorant binding protein 9 [Subpsaltria yangi]